MEYYSAIKNEVLPFVTTKMDLAAVILNEVSQKDTYLLIYPIGGI